MSHLVPELTEGKYQLAKIEETSRLYVTCRSNISVSFQFRVLECKWKFNAFCAIFDCSVDFI